MDPLLPLLTLAITAAGTHFAFSSDIAATSTVFVALAVPYALLSALSLWRMWRDGTLLDLFRFRSGDVTLGVVSAALLVAGVFIGRQFIVPAGSANEAWLVRLYLQLGPVPLERGASLLYGFAVMGIALMEELVWRGMVQQVLEERFGVRRGWLVTTALYALSLVPSVWQLQLAPAGKNPLLMFAALFCGAVWSFLSARKQRLPPSMISHAIFTYMLATQFRLWPG